MTTNVIDAIMGKGKTAAAINMINNSSEETRYLYITPYKTEIARIIDRCKEKDFYTPETTIKTIGLKILLNQGRNIVTTHALFHYFDQEIMDLCYSQGYVLIMDEVTDVVEKSDLSNQDRAVIMEKYVTKRDDGILVWRDDQMDYTGRFDDIKRQVDLECLAYYGKDIMLWLYPVEVFKAFRESYILTYMFNAQMQRYYYDYYGLDYKYMYVEGDSVDNYHFVDRPDEVDERSNYSELINIIDDRKLNMIGDMDGSLSKSWFERNEKNIIMDKLRRNLVNIFRNKKCKYTDGGYVKPKAGDCLWTVFSDYEEVVSDDGYAGGYAPHNMRATNDFSDRSVVAYCVNKFMDPDIMRFFTSHGIDVDESGFATSEMLQFIWRSAIRNGERITLYIPSLRMRMLLIEWINKHSFEPVVNINELTIREMRRR